MLHKIWRWIKMLLNKIGLLGPGLGKNSTGQPPPSGEVTNPISDWDTWYDFTDLSTIFQQSNGTVAVTNDGDPIGYCADKGTIGANVTQATEAARGEYDTTIHAAGGMTTDGSGGLWASAVETTAYAAGDYSCFIVFSADDNVLTDAYVWWNPHQSYFRVGSTDIPTQSHAGVQNAAAAFSGNFDVPHALLSHDDGANGQTWDWSWDGTDDVGAGTSSGMADEQDLFVGCRSSTGTDGINGVLYELAYRSPALTAGEITSLKTYVSDKYGITWA